MADPETRELKFAIPFEDGSGINYAVGYTKDTDNNSYIVFYNGDDAVYIPYEHIDFVGNTIDLITDIVDKKLC